MPTRRLPDTGYEMIAPVSGRRSRRLPDSGYEPIAPLPEPQWYDTAIGSVLRIVPSIIGGAAGLLAGLPAGPGLLLAGAAGGGAGAAAGEWGAQRYEAARGLRRGPTDWKAVGVEGAIGATPLDEAFAGAKLLRQGVRGRKVLSEIPTTLQAMGRSIPGSAVRGAAAATVGEGMRQVGNTGELPDLEQLIGPAAFGTAVGGGGAGLVRALQRYKGQAAKAPTSRTQPLEEAAPQTTWMDAPPPGRPIGIEPPPSRYSPTARGSSPEQYQIEHFRPTPPSNDVPAVGVPSAYTNPLDELEALLTSAESRGPERFAFLDWTQQQQLSPQARVAYQQRAAAERVRLFRETGSPMPPRAGLVPRERFTGLEPLPPNANREAYFRSTPPPDPNAPITDPSRLLPPPSPVDPDLMFSGVRKPEPPRLIGTPFGLLDEPRAVGRRGDLIPQMPGVSSRVPTIDESPVGDVPLSPEMDDFRRLLAGESVDQIRASRQAPTDAFQFLDRKAQRRLTPEAKAEYQQQALAERTRQREVTATERQARNEADKATRAQARDAKKLADLNAALGIPTQSYKPQSTVRDMQGNILGEWDPMRWRQQGADVDLSNRPVPPRPAPAEALGPTTSTALVDRQPQAGDYTMVDPASLKTDAKVYQHKSGADAAGVIDKLRRVEAWDETSGKLSPLLLHERLDGSRYVVDGHQRAGLAKRLQREGKPVPPLPAIVVREADGVTPEAARRMGALHNLRTGSADPMDIAKLLREGELTPLEMRMLSQISSDIGEKFKVGRDLARLGPQAFNYAAMNDIDPDLARAVGVHLTDDGQQVGALQVLTEQGIRNADEADALVRQVKNAGFGMEKQPDLFDPSGFVWKANPLLGVVAKLEAATRAAITRQRAGMGGAARNAERIAEAGIGAVDKTRATELAAAAARELEMLDSYAGKQTHTQEALKNAATLIHRGELSQADAVADVRAALELDFQGQPVRPGTRAIDGPAESLAGNAGARAADDLAGADDAGVVAPRQSGPGLFDEPNAAVPAPPIAGQPSQSAASVRSKEAWERKIARESGIDTDKLIAEIRPALEQARRDGDLEMVNYYEDRLRRFEGVARRKARKGGAESGEASTQVATTIAGAGIGAVVGGALPGTPEERRDRALGLGFAGALAGAAGGKAIKGKPTLPAGVPDLSKVPVNAQTKGVAGGAAPRGERFWRMTEWEPIPANKPLPKDRIDSFNLSTFSPEVQHDIHNLIVENMGYEAQRRGVMPVSAMLARAQRVAVNLEKTLKPGKAVNAEGQLAYGLAVQAISEKQHALAKQIASQEAAGQIDGNTQKAWLEALADQDVVVSSFMGMGSEGGRAMRARQVAKRMMPAEIRLIMAAEKEHPLSAQLRAAMLATDDPIEAVKLWQKQQQSGGFTKYILTNMLSGVQTQLRNTLGTATSTATRLIAKPLVTAPYDALRAALTGTPREVYAHEAIADMQGLAAGVMPALRDGLHVLRYGFSAKHLNDALAIGDTFKLPGREFAGGGKNPMNWVGRGMNASDRFFYTMNATAELHSRAYAMARRELDATKLKPGSPQYNDALAKRATALRLNPPEAITKGIDAAAREATFTGDPGPIGRAIGKMKHAHPSLNFAIAFERTASNIMRTGYEYSPASLAVKGVKRAMGDADAFGKTARDRSMMVGKGLAGTAALVPLAYLASTGQLTGDGPRDPAKRQQLMETGWMPHSFLVGGTYVNYQWAQPIAFPAAVVANAFEAWADETRRQEVSTEPRSAVRFATEAITRMGRSVLSQSFLTGLNDILNATEEGGPQGAKALENVLRTFVPLQGALRNVARATDPVVRAPRQFGDQIKSGIPGLSTDVEPMLTRYGEPVIRPGGPLRRSIAVPETSPVKRDWIDEELNRLDVQIGRPGTRVEIRDPFTGKLYRLTPEQTTAIREARGKNVRAELAMLIGLPGYADLPDDMKRELIARARSQSSSDVGDVAEYAVTSGDFGALEALLAPQRQIARESYRRER